MIGAEEGQLRLPSPVMKPASLLFPELRRFPDPQQRRKAMGRALSAAQFTPWYLVAAVGLLGLSVFLIFASRQWNLSAGARDVIGVWSLFGLPLVLFVVLLFCRRTIRRSLWRDLAAAGLPTCTWCGYDMTGGDARRCPECGKPPRRDPRSPPDRRS